MGLPSFPGAVRGGGEHRGRGRGRGVRGDRVPAGLYRLVGADHLPDDLC